MWEEGICSHRWEVVRCSISRESSVDVLRVNHRGKKIQPKVGEPEKNAEVRQ